MNNEIKYKLVKMSPELAKHLKILAFTQNKKESEMILEILQEKCFKEMEKIKEAEALQK